MAATENFQIVDGPPQHKLERALVIRDEGQRIVEFTIVFETTPPPSKLAIPVSVTVLGQNKGGETSWVVGGLVHASSSRGDEEECELLTSALRWLRGKRDLPYYRAYYDARTRQGHFGFSDKPLIIDTIFDDPVDLVRDRIRELLLSDSLSPFVRSQLYSVELLLKPERERLPQN